METIELEIVDSGTLGLDLSDGGGIGLALERSAGTTNYNALSGKPSIEGHVLVGDSTLPQIGIGGITPQDIDTIIYG